MTNTGRLIFGVYQGSVQTSPRPRAYNDGQWHHVVASLGPAGMALYVDGVSVGQPSDVTTGQRYNGYWRVGGDNVDGVAQPADQRLLRRHHRRGGGLPPGAVRTEVQTTSPAAKAGTNDPPTADFTFDGRPWP